MLENVLTAFVAIVLALVVYRYRRVIVDGLRRFDARNAERIAEQEADRRDPQAHIRHTLMSAGEQVEAVSEFQVSDARLGTPVTRYVFEGKHYATRWEAESARAQRIREIANRYYAELPRALAERTGTDSVRGSTEPPKPANEASPQQQPSGSNVVPFRRGNETLH
jgi:hypothetical protein